MKYPAYRQLVFQKYASVQAPHWQEHDPRAEARWNRATCHRLEGWLPGTKSARCLDLGCGAGQLLEALRLEGYSNLAGVDAGPEAVSIAKAKGLNIELGDIAEYLRRAGEGFDLVCGFDVIEHFSKDEVLEVLRLVWTRLNPKGVLILQTPNAVSPWASHYRYGDLSHEVIYTPWCLSTVLRLTGFQDIAVREVAPHLHGLKSAIRSRLWSLIWLGCAVWNLAETGTLCGGVYTRNMLVRAVKDDAFQW